MNIAVIPARGGSKRIPRKNIKPFLGKPMIAWAIDIAKSSNLFEHVVVSTDDDEIANIALNFGAEVPFMRTKTLADDLTTTAPVIADAIKSCQNLGWSIDSVCCIYPCVPLLQINDLGNALEILQDKATDFVYPVTEYSHPIQRAMRKLESGEMQFFNSEFELTRTQDLEKSYHDAGLFYWGTSSAWLDGKKMHTDGLGMPIPNWRVVDIDSLDDWKRAELIYSSISANE